MKLQVIDRKHESQITHDSSNNSLTDEKRLNDPITGLDRPLGLREVEAPGISIQPAHGGGKAVSPTHQPPLLPGRYCIPGTHFC